MYPNMKPFISPECWKLLSQYLHEFQSASANPCDWSNCFEFGVFDGLNTILLNAEARENLKADCRFVFLCPSHFQLAMANLSLDDE